MVRRFLISISFKIKKAGKIETLKLAPRKTEFALWITICSAYWSKLCNGGNSFSRLSNNLIPSSLNGVSSLMILKAASRSCVWINFSNIPKVFYYKSESWKKYLE